MSFVGRILIPAPHGQLEAIYRPRDGAAERVALLMHPHPLYGGSMHNKVIYNAAKALDELGWETLRFNFRGVGASSGVFADGAGELDDARTALAFLREQRATARRTLLLGFSFGAAVALALAARAPDVDAIIAIGTPPGDALGQLAGGLPEPPIAFIHGERDEIAPLAALRDWLRRQAPQIGAGALHVIAGADHFFADHLAELRAGVRAAAQTVT
jgi:alpha/beta superfamily hydrolase